MKIAGSVMWNRLMLKRHHIVGPHDVLARSVEMLQQRFDVPCGCEDVQNQYFALVCDSIEDDVPADGKASQPCA